MEEVRISLSAPGLQKATSRGYRGSEQKAQLLWVHQGWMCWSFLGFFSNLKARIFTSVLSKATGLFSQVMVDFLQLLCPFRNLYPLFSFDNSAGLSLKFSLYPVSAWFIFVGFVILPTMLSLFSRLPRLTITPFCRVFQEKFLIK